eukprot:gb/GECG01014735.1/.p1 GENE.gb/GECG01014735.1/~~gb/GECG01014735.1/.p1  ORF type:complete len:758 (+),score=99.21 gb/GECG01014735.1/:1-2274(+)
MSGKHKPRSPTMIVVMASPVRLAAALCCCYRRGSRCCRNLGKTSLMLDTLEWNGSPVLPAISLPPEAFVGREVCGHPVQRDTWAVILFSSGHFALSVFENKIPYRSRPQATTTNGSRSGTVLSRFDSSKRSLAWQSADALSAIKTLGTVRSDSVEDLEAVTQRLSREDTPEVISLFHKTLHKYTTRKKQGGSQSSRDATGAKATSMGAQIRRNNEILLATQIHELLASLRPLLACCGRIFIGASRRNMNILFGQQVGGQAPSSVIERAYSKNSSNKFPKEVSTFLNESFGPESRDSLLRHFQNVEGCILHPTDDRIRKITFVTGRPTYQETQLVYKKLRRAKVKAVEASELNIKPMPTETHDAGGQTENPLGKPSISSPLSADESTRDVASAQWKPLINAIVQLDVDGVMAEENVLMVTGRVDYAVLELLCRAMVEGLLGTATNEASSWRANAYAIADHLAGVIAETSDGVTDALEFCRCLRHYGRRVQCSVPETASAVRAFLGEVVQELKMRFREQRSGQAGSMSAPGRRQNVALQSSQSQTLEKSKTGTFAPTYVATTAEEDEELNKALEQAEREKATLLQRQQKQIKLEQLQREFDTVSHCEVPKIQTLLQKQTRGISDPDIKQIYEQQWKDVAQQIWEVCIERLWEPEPQVHADADTPDDLEESVKQIEEQYQRAAGLQELLQYSNNLSDVLECLGWNTGASFCAAEAMPEDWLRMMNAMRNISADPSISCGAKGEKTNAQKKKKRSTKKKKR